MKCQYRGCNADGKYFVFALRQYKELCLCIVHKERISKAIESIIDPYLKPEKQEDSNDTT